MVVQVLNMAAAEYGVARMAQEVQQFRLQTQIVMEDMETGEE